MNASTQNNTRPGAATIAAAPTPNQDPDAGLKSPLAELLDRPVLRYQLALEPQSFSEAMEIARLAAKIRLCGVESEADAIARIMTGRAIGLPAMASIQGIALIYQRKTNSYVPCMYAKLKVALLLSRPDVVEFIRPKVDANGVALLSDKQAVWVGKRKGQPEQDYEFTWDMAVKAGLVGRGAKDDGETANNYDRHPKAMLQWRAAGRLADIIGGDVLNGLRSREDVEDEAERQAAEDAARGTVPVEVQKQIPVRDWTKEAEGFRAALKAAVDAGDRDAVRAVRSRFDAFEKEGAPKDVCAGFRSYYEELRSKATAAKAQGSANGAAGSAQVSQQQAPAKTPSSPPPPPPTAATPRGGYLPPNQRGDAYDGPDEPVPPFGDR